VEATLEKFGKKREQGWKLEEEVKEVLMVSHFV
jgi:hypothetical protein